MKFFLLFLLVDRGSRSEFIPLTNGSGSGRPKNLWIRNTVGKSSNPDPGLKYWDGMRSRICWSARGSERSWLTSRSESVRAERAEPGGGRTRRGNGASPSWLLVGLSRSFCLESSRKVLNLPRRSIQRGWLSNPSCKSGKIYHCYSELWTL